MKIIFFTIGLVLLSVFLLAQPNFVTIAGSLQNELGCPGDWDPGCTSTHLVYNSEDKIWQGTFNIPAGDYEYLVAIDNSWIESYGAGAVANGGNISISLPMDTDVKFYYDHESHWVTDNVNSIIVTAAGNFQSEIGCGADWDPGCLASWLLDIDGDGIYTRSMSNIPSGSYEFKIALNEAWTESYPAGNVPFYVPAGDVSVIFFFNSNNNEVSVDVQVNSLPIPVIETWGLIIVILAFSIIGIRGIKKSKNLSACSLFE
jgi:hypothetical protein